MTAKQTRTDLGWPMLLAAVIICAIGGHVTAALGDWVQEAKLLASDNAALDNFGISVSISGDIAVIGAGGDDDNGFMSGSAYVFRYDGTNWVQEAKLLPSDAAAGDYFGGSVSISGDTAVIGAYLDDDNGSWSGSAYVFRCYDGWVQEAKLLPSDGAADDWFGYSVAISGDTAIIGAYQDDDNGSDSGAAYVFRRDGTGWVEEAKLLPSDGAVYDEFGYSVAISGDTAIIGAVGDDDNASWSGSAYVFRYDGTDWVQEPKLLPSDGAEADYFGASVSISGDVAVIGAYLDDDNGNVSGSAYVFRHHDAGWVEDAKLLASDGAPGEWFGWSVAVSGDTAVIGAFLDDDNGDDCGSAYVFRYDGREWPEDAKLLASDGEADDAFGYSVSIFGDTAVIGAYRDDDNGFSSGSAYIFERAVECPADLDGDGDVDAADLLFLLAAWGTPDGDVDGDGDTDTADLLALLAAWGVCP